MSQDKEQVPPSTQTVTVSYGMVAALAVVIFLGIWVIAQGIRVAFRSADYPVQKHYEPDNKTLSHGTRREMLSPNTPLHAAPVFQSVASQRTLRRFYALRAYPGAPPRIPHPIKEQGGHADNCLACHKEGGYTPRFGAFAPITPHPNNLYCMQCHVPIRTQQLFRPTVWKKPTPPRIRRSALGGSPPPIPHPLQMRHNCLACHAGPGAVREIRTPHPDRLHCMQCHVRRDPKVAPFRSKYGVFSARSMSAQPQQKK